ncbi:hypothetical protein Tco_1452827 [Tanacetum coccineum]
MASLLVNMTYKRYFFLGLETFTLCLGATVLTSLVVLVDVAALGELCLAALTSILPDFVKTADGMETDI